MVAVGRQPGRTQFAKLYLYSAIGTVVTVTLLASLFAQDGNTASSLGYILTGESVTELALMSTYVLPSDTSATQRQLQQQQQQQQPDGVYTPVDCGSFVTKTSVDTDPTGREKVLVRTNTDHSFLISLHKQVHDKVRWDIARHGRNYEWALENTWAKVLKESPPGSRVVDVGGNIGYYSLFSASLGAFVVDSFEPNPTNILRFCESIGINYWGAAPAPWIQIWEMGISNEKGQLNFQPDLQNPGAGKFVGPKVTGSDLVKIPVTTLDDFTSDRGWFDTKPNIAILKVDVERHEAQVMQGAVQLLKSGMVQNIFTEMGSEGSRKENIAALNIVIDAGYYLAGQGGFRGPNKPSEWRHDSQLAENIMKHLEERRHPYLNLWWSLQKPV